MKNFIIAMFLLLNLQSAGVATAGEAKATSVAVELPQGAVKVFLPITMNYVDMFKDGGTIVLKFSDARKHAFEFYLDARITDAPAGQRHFYWGAYPQRVGSQELGIGSKAEKALLVILEGWQRAGSPAEPANNSDGDLVDRVIKMLRERNTEN